jgi:hypothetical protein
MLAIGCLPHFVYYSSGLPKQARPFPLQSGPFSGYAQILAGAAECDYINRLNIRAVDLANIAKVLHIGAVALRNADTCRFDFRGPHGIYTMLPSRKGETADTIK